MWHYVYILKNMEQKDYCETARGFYSITTL